MRFFPVCRKVDVNTRTTYRAVLPIIVPTERLELPTSTSATLRSNPTELYRQIKNAELNLVTLANAHRKFRRNGTLERDNRHLVRLPARAILFYVDLRRWGRHNHVGFIMH